jgi:hypothetical protein
MIIPATRTEKPDHVRSPAGGPVVYASMVRMPWFPLASILLAGAAAAGTFAAHARRAHRARAMVERMEREGFDSRSNHREFEAVCPRRFSNRFIARMNRYYMRASLAESSHTVGKAQPQPCLGINTPNQNLSTMHVKSRFSWQSCSTSRSALTTKEDVRLARM